MVEKEFTQKDYSEVSKELFSLKEELKPNKDLVLQNFDTFMQKLENNEILFSESFEKDGIQYVNIEEFANLFEQNFGIDKNTTIQFIETINKI